VSQARILAVDDQLYFRVFLEDLLRESGFEVETANGGQEALALLETMSFDVVLTDLVMPGMDGSELVQRIKENWPAQEVVVVTSVGDVKTAVDAMKLGATDYLLKPLDKAALLRSLDGILKQKQIRDEHRQLVAENLEYLSVFSQYERALGMFSTLELEALADRVVETFCLETNAHGGVLWLTRPGERDRMRLAGVGGLVRVEDEEAEIVLDSLPDEIRQLGEDGQGAMIVGKGPEGPTSMYVPFRTDGPLLGALRLTDKIDGTPFGFEDVEIADRLSPFGARAIANALAFRALERRSFRDATTQAYSRAYFEDVVENEIQKALRFGRTFSLVRMELDHPSQLREQVAPAEVARLLEGFAAELTGALRTTDLLAVEGDASFCALLPESEAIGSIVAKRRLRSVLERSEAFAALDLGDRPTLLAATVNFPFDGADLATMRACLDDRIDEDRASWVRAHDLEKVPFRGLVDTLLGDAPMGRPETAEQMTRFLLSEIRRRPHERGLLYVAPGASLLEPLRDGLADLRDGDIETQIVLIAERHGDFQPGVPVTWVSPVRTGTDSPFVVYYGEGPPYALVREAGSEPNVALFHTSDPIVVEQLAFQLSRDLGIPIGD
jgi:diguanylate cyclase (GGDEF)-like protein